RRFRRPRISPYKKKTDAIRGGDISNQTRDFGWFNTNDTYFVFSPTMRPRDYQNEQGTHNRHSRRVEYTGYRERVMVTAQRPVMWRRIVVWSYIRIGNATPVIGTDSDGNDFFKRNVTPVVGNSTIDIREFLFA